MPNTPTYPEAAPRGADPIERCLALVTGAHAEDGTLSHLSHALQCAANAEAADAPATLVAACLVHDIGWALRARDPGVEQDEARECHAAIGEHFLAPWFTPEVTRPIGLHVDAKRYLCAIDEGYLRGLSPVSVRTLRQQGEVFSPEQAEAFIRQPFAREAVALRRFDEAAKRTDARPPPIEHFLPWLEAGLRADLRRARP